MSDLLVEKTARLFILLIVRKPIRLANQIFVLFDVLYHVSSLTASL